MKKGFSDYGKASDIYMKPLMAAEIKKERSVERS
jgi:hypothetical protein